MEGGSAFNLHSGTIGEEKHNKITKLLTFYLDSKLRFKKDLDSKDIATIHYKIADDKELKELFDTLQKEFLKEEMNTINDCCLSHSEALLEMKWIQEQLKDTDKVGYVYTNGVNLSNKHAEVAVITKTDFIKPVTWYVDPSQRLLPNEKSSPSVRLDSKVIYNNDSQNLPCPQSSNYGCGSLGINYLKQLLKNDGELLEKYSLKFPYYDDKGETSWFFFPPPHVLRYSQSGNYNKIIATMLNDASSNNWSVLTRLN